MSLEFGINYRENLLLRANYATAPQNASQLLPNFKLTIGNQIDINRTGVIPSKSATPPSVQWLPKGFNNMRSQQHNKSVNFKAYRHQASSPGPCTFHERLNWDSLLSVSYSNVGNHGVKDTPIGPETQFAKKRKAIPDELATKIRVIEILAPPHKNITVDENQNYCVMYASTLAPQPYKPSPCSACCKDYKGGCQRRNLRLQECLRCCEPTEPIIVTNFLPPAKKKPVPLPPTPPYTPSPMSEESYNFDDDDNDSGSGTPSSATSSPPEEEPVLKFETSERKFKDPKAKPKADKEGKVNSQRSATQWKWEPPPCLSCIQKKNQLKCESVIQTQLEVAEFGQNTEMDLCRDSTARKGRLANPKKSISDPPPIVQPQGSNDFQSRSKSRRRRLSGKRCKKEEPPPCYPICCWPPSCGSKPPCCLPVPIKSNATIPKNSNKVHSEQTNIPVLPQNEMYPEFPNAYQDTDSNGVTTEQVILGLQELFQDFTTFNQSLPECGKRPKVRKQKSCKTMSGRASRKRKACGCLE